MTRKWPWAVPLVWSHGSAQPWRGLDQNEWQESTWEEIRGRRPPSWSHDWPLMLKTEKWRWRVGAGRAGGALPSFGVPLSISRVLALLRTQTGKLVCCTVLSGNVNTAYTRSFIGRILAYIIWLRKNNRVAVCPILDQTVWLPGLWPEKSKFAWSHKWSL